MITEKTDVFPLSKNRSTKGSRRLVREKVLQVLLAYEVSGIHWQEIFSHVYFRKFNLGDEEEKPTKKLLTSKEIIEIESDIPINWTKDEIQFGENLIRKTLEQKEYVSNLIIKFAANWELERIAVIDRILMEIAVTELIMFDDIPPKVSINEAIDIAKKYSTYKSGTFINGVLDSVQEQLIKENKIHKKGRGLINK